MECLVITRSYFHCSKAVYDQDNRYPSWRGSGRDFLQHESAMCTTTCWWSATVVSTAAQLIWNKDHWQISPTSGRQRHGYPLPLLAHYCKPYKEMSNQIDRCRRLHTKHSQGVYIRLPSKRTQQRRKLHSALTAKSLGHSADQRGSRNTTRSTHPAQ